MMEMEDHTSEPSEARIPFLDYKTYTERNLFLPPKDGADAATVLAGRVHVPESRRAIVAQALNQFSNLLNSKPFLINVSGRDFKPLFAYFPTVMQDRKRNPISKVQPTSAAARKKKSSSLSV